MSNRKFQLGWGVILANLITQFKKEDLCNLH